VDFDDNDDDDADLLKLVALNGATQSDSVFYVQCKHVTCETSTTHCNAHVVQGSV